MKIIVSGHSKEGHAYLLRLPTNTLVKRVKSLLSKNRNEAIKSILSHGQLEDVFHPNAIAHIDADIVITRKSVSWNLVKGKKR